MNAGRAEAEAEAEFRGGAALFQWRFVRTQDDCVCVLATRIATDPITGATIRLSLGADELPARRDLAHNPTELLKKIARGEDLITILYELIGAIEHYRPNVTAAILSLRGGHLYLQQHPGCPMPASRPCTNARPTK